MSQFTEDQKFRALGMMSGTSLDGLDLCLCEFWFDGTWHFSIQEATTRKYESRLAQRLSDSRVMRPAELNVLNFELGKKFGQYAQEFLNGRQVDLVASHGHTIFHAPHLGMTLQIGHPAGIAIAIDAPVVGDFRSIDVALGGQGAPLVPVGDALLFGNYDACLNLGGIANVSLDGAHKAFDICPVNTVLNHLSHDLGLEYDHGGENARLGTLNRQVLKRLNDQEFYAKLPPKSLGIEWVESTIFPLIREVPTRDAMRTFVEHIAIQIGKVLPDGKRTLVTGGGAHNDFLIERLRALTNSEVVLPEAEIIDFKEALIFAFLGMLRWRKEANTWSSVTGASLNSIGGCVYLPHPKSS